MHMAIGARAVAAGRIAVFFGLATLAGCDKPEAPQSDADGADVEKPSLTMSPTPDLIDADTQGYLECAAYYLTTANAIHGDDEEVATQYDERAVMAFDLASKAATDTGATSDELNKRYRTLTQDMEAQIKGDESGIAALAGKYDDLCTDIMDVD